LIDLRVTQISRLGVLGGHEVIIQITSITTISLVLGPYSGPEALHLIKISLQFYIISAVQFKMYSWIITR